MVPHVETTSPLFQARVSVLKRWLPLPLDRESYSDLRDVGFSRNDVDAAMNYLVSLGEADIDCSCAYLLVCPVEVTV